MEHKFILFLIFFSMNALFLVFILVLKGLKFDVFLSFEFAFLSALLIVTSSFLHYKKNVFKKASIHEFEQKPLLVFKKNIINNAKILKFKIINDDFEPSLKLALKNFTLFFGFLKLVSYTVFVCVFLFLHKQGLLSIFAYLSGVSVIPLSVFLFLLYERRK